MAGLCDVNDSLFGPTVGHDCRGGFDFTLLFEYSILGVLPTSIFLLASAWRVGYLAKSKQATHNNVGRIWKMIVATILFSLQLAMLIVWGNNEDERTAVLIASASLNVIAALQVVLLVWLEDSRSIRPSSLLSVYLLTLLFDSANLRTLWLRDNALPGILLSTIIATKCALLGLETRSKKKYIRSPLKDLAPESTSGLLSRSILWWINSIFVQGWNSVLSIDSLAELPPDILSSELGARAADAWQGRKVPERRAEFAWVLLKMLWRPLLAVIIPRLCRIGFTFAQPFLISRVLSFLGQPDDQLSRNQGYGLVGATALVFLGLAVSNVHYDVNNTRFLTIFRGAAVTLIYNHSLGLQGSTHDTSAAVTLMGTDVARIVSSIEDFNECWARVIEAAIAITLLALQLGWTCIIPALIITISFFASGRVSMFIGDRQKTWIDAVQKRITATSGMLANMRSIKMMGLDGYFRSTIQGLRVEETHRMAAYRWSIVWSNVISNLPASFNASITLTAFAVHAAAQGTSSLDTTLAFTSLSLISLLSAPVAGLLHAVPSIVSSLGCFDRIQNFLLLTPIKDSRILLSPAISSEPSIVDQEERVAGIRMTSWPIDRHNTGHANAVVVQDLQVSSPSTSQLLLQNMNFAVPRGSITMIIGPVGSGKSNLLRAVLGQVNYDHGSISISTRSTAVSTQTPWLPNTTIRHAICGSTSYGESEEWYRKTIQACSLDHDVSLLPQGDLTPIGSGSTTLSGGQQQRIALARALYSRPELAVLDDVLSALDVNTCEEVFQNLFGPSGLFKALGTTVLLVTHAVEYLRYADHIILLVGGKIKQQGTFDQAVQQGWVDAAKETPENRKPAENPAIAPLPNEPSMMKKAAEKKAKDNRLDDMRRATGDMSLYRFYYGFIGQSQFAILISFAVINVFSLYFSDIWLKWWSDIGGGEIPRYVSTYLALSVLSSLGMGGYIWTLLIWIAPSTARQTHQKLLNTVIRAPLSLFTTTDAGMLLNRFSQDMTLIESELPTGVLITLSGFFSCIASVALVATGSTYMVIPVVFLMIVVGLVQRIYLRTSRQLRLLDIEANSPLYSHFLETLDGLTTICAFGWQEQFRQRQYTLLDQSQKPYYTFQCIQRWLTLVMYLITGSLAVIVVGLATSLRSASDAGLLGVSLNNILGFSNTVSSLVQGYMMLETSLGSLARLKSFCENTTPEDRETENIQPNPVWPECGLIEFRNVTASYGSSIGIHQVSLRIDPGTKLGICGRTGSGKSTLLATLLRLLEIDSGTLLVDNIDITTVPHIILRDRITAISQHPFIIPGSIRVNLDPGGVHSDSAIKSALQKVQLWAWTDAHGGIDVELTASSMSQGQQQLLSLGRALLRRSTILLLDEATSNMDKDTDSVIREVMREEFASCTVISVAHRLDSIMGCDTVVVMDRGYVSEIGSPDILMKKGGIFAELASMKY